MSEAAAAGENPDVAPVAVTDPVEEADYRAASAMFLDPPPSQQKIQILIFSLIGFIAATFAQDAVRSLVELAMLIGVLVVHEVGHVIGMRMYGYRDVRMFFIPFFGAAAAGKKRGVARWKEGVVLLLGPVPGIAIGCVLAYAGGPDELRTLALMMIAVNAINLLPLSQLDGGQLFQIILFARHRHLEIVFHVVTAGLIAVAGVLGSLWFVAFIGVFMLIQVPHRQRVLATAHRLRGQLPADPAALSDSQRRALYREMWTSLPEQWQRQWRGKPRPQAQMMEDLHERATQLAPDANASVALFAIWLVALVVAAAGASAALPPAVDVGVEVPRATLAEWRVVTHATPSFSVEMPVAPAELPDEDGAGMLIGQLGDEAAYSVHWTRVGSDGTWLAIQNETVLKRGRVISDLRVDEHERRSSVELEGGLVETSRVLVAGGVGYMVIAIARPDIDVSRFLQSFRAN